MLGVRTGWAPGLVAFGVVVAVAACGAEALNGAGGTGGPYDAGGVDVLSGADGTTDGSPADSAAGDTGGHLTQGAIFVQASPSLPDVRLCWQSGGVTTSSVPFPGTGAMPGSNYPGIPLGGGASLSDVSALDGLDKLYAIDAENLARLEQSGGQNPCSKLICGAGTNLPPPCLRLNQDYWEVTPTFSQFGSGTSVVALTGCLGTAIDPLATLARCGPGWTAVTGNLSAEGVGLTSATPADAGELVVQAVLFSPSLAQLLQPPDAGDAGSPDSGDSGDDGASDSGTGAGATVVVSFGTAEAGVPFATLAAEDDLGAPVRLQLASGLPAFGALGFSVDVPSLGAEGHEWMSLVQAQQLVDPTEDPTVFFGQPRTYLVAVVGDPNATHAFVSGGDAGYDGTGLHLLVLASPAPPPPASGEP